MKQTLKGSHKQKRLSNQGLSTMGVNLLKFPPGFFGDDPFKMSDQRGLMGNRSKQ